MFRSLFPLAAGLMIGLTAIGSLEAMPIVQRIRARVPANCRIESNWQVARNARCGERSLVTTLKEVVKQADGALAPAASAESPENLLAVVAPLAGQMNALSDLASLRRRDLDDINQKTQATLATWSEHVLTFENPQMEREEQQRQLLAAQQYAAAVADSQAKLVALDAVLAEGRDLQRLVTSLQYHKEVQGATSQLQQISDDATAKIKTFRDACEKARESLNSAAK